MNCTRCNNLISERTAQKNNGLCAVCKRHDDAAARHAIAQSWVDNPETLPGTNGIPLPEDYLLRAYVDQARRLLYPTSLEKMEAACHKVFDKAYARWRKRGPDSLSDRDKYALAIETFYGEVINGGLKQYLGNTSGAFAKWAADGFEAIGVPAGAAVMRNVEKLFEGGVIPENREERSEQLSKLDIEALDALANPFTELNSDDDTIRRKLFQYLKETRPRRWWGGYSD